MHAFGVALLRFVMRGIGRRSSPALRGFIVTMSALHLQMLRRSRGRFGGSLGLRYGVILMLTTTGRHSGQARTVPLLAVRDGMDFAVIASHGGLDQPPAWWWNLRADPSAVIEVGGRQFPVRAEQVAGERREQLWPRFVRAFPGYEDYRRRTSRELPILILHPAS